MAGELSVPERSKLADDYCARGIEAGIGAEYFTAIVKLAVEAGGNIRVATLVNGGITVFSPEGEILEFWKASEGTCTNIAFGGPDLRKVYITLSGYGTLIEVDWPRPGLSLNF